MGFHGTRRNNSTVLLVEDEVLISHLVADWLAERGFAVHEAATGDEALDYIDAGGEVDVLFTDVNLPGEHRRRRAGRAGARDAARTADRLCLRPLPGRARSRRWCRARCSSRSPTTRPMSARCWRG